MPQASHPILIHSAQGGIVFAPGEKFFVRRVPLATDGDPTTQVSLALEGFSPFPAAQLYYGFLTNTTRTEALVFAAYRKNFTPEETAAWTGAAAVLPSFAACLGSGSSVPAAGITLRDDEVRHEAVAWDGSSELPAAVIVRVRGTENRDALVAEVRGKTGLSDDVPVKVFRSAVEILREGRELILRLNSSGIETRFDETALAQADVRDKDMLQQRRVTLRRDKLLWRVFATILGGLAACVVLEFGLLATRFWLASKQTEITAQTPAVKRIEQMQTMAKRLEEISTQRLLPFEMISLINDKRPRTVEFTSVNTKGLWQLDIRAQATDDPATFETDIRRLPGIERVESFDKQAREGMTTFRLEVTFKPGWFQAGGGK